ncbi:hypothetical protein Q8W13_20560 [Photobacterium damselae subsp. piscicida]|nr:hypothetical protein [Photobacterium damselae subsp. piscicida]MDP2545786.1 hypothetical protein [Photobacterium damselae subsp. piscicida]
MNFTINKSIGVTTLAVDIGKQLAEETERRKAVEEELEQLKQLLDAHIKAQSALFNYIKKRSHKLISPLFIINIDLINEMK